MSAIVQCKKGHCDWKRSQAKTLRARSALGWSFHLHPVVLSREALTHQSNPQDVGAELQSSAPLKGILKLSVTGGFSWETARMPQGRGWHRAAVSAPFGRQKKGSSSSILGLPGGFMAELSFLPRFWHPDSGSWIVLLHLECCFLALALGDYCLQFPFDRCLEEQYWAKEGKKSHHLAICVQLCELQSVLRDKGKGHMKQLLGWHWQEEKLLGMAVGEGKRAGKCVLFQFSAFLQSSDNFIYCISPPHTLSSDERIGNHLRHMTCLKSITPKYTTGWNEVHFPARG